MQLRIQSILPTKDREQGRQSDQKNEKFSWLVKQEQKLPIKNCEVSQAVVLSTPSFWPSPRRKKSALKRQLPKCHGNHFCS